MNYSDLLNTREWQDKRQEILKRDKWKCQRCTDPPDQLHVHHKYYDYGLKPWEYPNDAYITLCIWCHEKEEVYRKSIKNLMKEIFKLDIHAEYVAEILLKIVWEESNKRGL